MLEKQIISKYGDIQFKDSGHLHCILEHFLKNLQNIKKEYITTKQRNDLLDKLQFFNKIVAI